MADLFTVDSNHPIGLGTGLDARKARKVLRLNSAELECWEIVKNDVLLSGWCVKFRPGTVAHNVLLNTGDAVLNHYLGRGRGIERWNGLEELRSAFRDL